MWPIEFKLTEVIIFNDFFINDHKINFFNIYKDYIGISVWKMALTWQ